jgi:hypothetical protein
VVISDHRVVDLDKGGLLDPFIGEGRSAPYGWGPWSALVSGIAATTLGAGGWLEVSRKRRMNPALFAFLAVLGLALLALAVGLIGQAADRADAAPHPPAPSGTTSAGSLLIGRASLSEESSEKEEAGEELGMESSESAGLYEEATQTLKASASRSASLPRETEYFRLTLAGGRVARLLFQGDRPTQAEIKKLIANLELNLDQYPEAGEAACK